MTSAGSRTGVARGADVKVEFFATAGCGQHRDCDEAARSMVETGPRPDVTPCVARGEILKVFIEGCRVFQRAIDVRVAQDAAPNGQACFVCRIFHDVTPGWPRFESIESESYRANGGNVKRGIDGAIQFVVLR